MKEPLQKILFLLGFFLMMPGLARAEISFVDGRWSTTFNFGPCSMRGGGGMPACGFTPLDGIVYDEGANDIDGNFTQVTPLANNPIGGGGNGHRMWVGDGQNQQSAPINIRFSHQKELWVRWYERYEAGFDWNFLGYTKELYFTTDAPGISPIAGFHGSGIAGPQLDSEFVIVAQGGAPAYQVVAEDYGWEQIMGGRKSDGLFHCYEVHIKMDTNGIGGIGQIWIDGVLRESNLNVNWSNNNLAAQNGLIYFQVRTNQNDPLNGRVMYVDLDDVVIYNTTPPNTDSQGNPFIGPINDGGDTTSPVAPTGLQVE